jgi:hypothetical protein
VQIKFLCSGLNYCFTIHFIIVFSIFFISFSLGVVSTKLISRAKKSEESKNSKDKDAKNKKPPTEEDNSENNSYEGAE